ncbi:chaplin [Streptomyces broussonetiae]|uniref:DUF320 domain-containing protein n=1 Tax=Streptomyces broussonetiae TaxID=2686304 RepID=A0A6I6NM20_9ACTN|nr:chaplin [Streptomyces broussonetiae]QHA08967.1 DUF320 domain-containing protein [Streptomyces broussonetiae]
MNRVTRTGVVTLFVASGAMAVAGPVHADSAADGSAVGSPGLISGNTVQLPVHVPVNICGNTVDVAGLLNPAMGNSCTNAGAKDRAGATGQATAVGRTQDSPGVVSGNDLQLPIDLPLNVSGNTVNVVGVGNPVFGNESVNSPDARPSEPARTAPEPPARTTPPARSVPPVKPTPHKPRSMPRTTHAITPEWTKNSLAETGADGIWTAVAASGTALLGGTVLYRRFRVPTAR